MRKLFISVILCACTLSVWADYFVAGNGTSGSVWCDGKSWVVNGSAMTNEDGTWTKVFSEVPIGTYQFKVTDGKQTWIGYTKYSSECGNLYAVSSGSDGNVQFELQQAQDVTISYDGKTICLSGSIGNNYPDESKWAMVGVPSEYEGVMLQAFYWDSQSKTTYSNTKYKTLQGYADEIGKTFDLVWMPPSGNGSGVGYYTKCYSNLSSAWGTKSELTELIDMLHSNGCKVLADVVINHFQSTTGWAKSFATNDFGEYGKYKITSEHICAGDEAFTSSTSDSRTLAHGNADTGTNDAGCRDLDHTSEYVQQMCEAYDKWLLGEIGFDGFRYDMTKGYSGGYLSQYNLASEPFFSVSECWDDLGTIKNHLESSSYNTLEFDFPLKFKMNSWKGGSSYSNLVKAGMRSQSLERFAVTFIDNHDTFHRSDNQGDEFLGYNTNLSNKRDEILAANAYLLMMPGVPCVFWPHWYTYKTELKRMIDIRKLLGIHSESKVTDEKGSQNSYTATIEGHNGKALLRMGTSRDKEVPAGYTLVCEENLFSIYSTIATDLDEVKSDKESGRAEKVIIDNALYIKSGDKIYNMQGQMIR